MAELTYQDWLGNNNSNYSANFGSPTPSYDYGSYQPDYSNYLADSAASADTNNDQKKDQDQQSQASAQQTAADTATAAQPQNGYTQAALANTQGQQAQSGQTQYAPFEIGGKVVNIPTNLDTYSDEFMQWFIDNDLMSLFDQPAASQDASTTSTSSAPAPTNPLVSSAGGDYQADDVYDPSKQYGRQPNGGYVYSSSAKDLQNKLAQMGLYKGNIDGYFGNQTQEALDAYLAKYGKKQESNPQDGAEAAALAASASEASATTNPATGTSTNGWKPGKVDNSGTSNNDLREEKALQRQKAEQEWYDKEFEKYWGSPPDRRVLDDKRIREYVDEQRRKAKQIPTAEDEINDELLKLEAQRRQAEGEEKKAQIEENRNKAFEPVLQNKLMNGMTVDQIIAEGDLSLNRWLKDNWDELSYTYRDLGPEYPSGDSGAPDLTPEKAPKDFHADTIAELNSEYERVTGNTIPNVTAPVYGVPRNGSVGNVYGNEAAGTGTPSGLASASSVAGNAASVNTPTNPDITGAVNTQFSGARGANAAAMPQAEDLTDSELLDYAIQFGILPNNSAAEKYSDRDDLIAAYNQGLAVSGNSSRYDSRAFAEQGNFDMAPEVAFKRWLDEDQRSGLSIDQIIENAMAEGSYEGRQYANWVRSNAGTSVDSNALTPDELRDFATRMRTSRDSNTGTEWRNEGFGSGNFAGSALAARDQGIQRSANAINEQFNNPYMQQFQQEFSQLKQQFPTYSDTALMDMVLFNEEMRNGQSSYYKWLANSLG